MSYNRLFNPKYYSWRKTTKKSDANEDSDRDVQYKHTDDLTRWKFKDHMAQSVVDCTEYPLHQDYWGYKTTVCPIVIEPHIKKQYRFKNNGY